MRSRASCTSALEGLRLVRLSHGDVLTFYASLSELRSRRTFWAAYHRRFQAVDSERGHSTGVSLRVAPSIPPIRVHRIFPTATHHRTIPVHGRTIRARLICNLKVQARDRARVIRRALISASCEV